jgi:hypothetical protein
MLIGCAGEAMLKTGKKAIAGCRFTLSASRFPE